jgi:hypothetical protein
MLASQAGARNCRSADFCDGRVGYEYEWLHGSSRSTVDRAANIFGQQAGAGEAANRSCR